MEANGLTCALAEETLYLLFPSLCIGMVKNGSL